MGEMVAANGIAYRNRKTHTLLHTCDEEHPVASQLFGDTPEVLYNSVPVAEAAGADIIDLNMGCSVPKVRKAGAGIELMADPERGIACATAMVEAATVPITVKLRTGLIPGDERYMEMASRLEEVGVSAITLHARSAEEKMSGRADWSHISRLVEAVSIPVIGNGDLTSPSDAVEMMEKTGCAGVMYARGAMGRPWIFSQVAAALEGRQSAPDPSPAGIMAIALCHAQMLVLEFGEHNGICQMRGQMSHYSKGQPHALMLRRGMQSVHTLAQMKELVSQYLKTIVQHEADASRDMPDGTPLL